jgi:hypothetical protein
MEKDNLTVDYSEYGSPYYKTKKKSGHGFLLPSVVGTLILLALSLVVFFALNKTTKQSSGTNLPVVESQKK